MALARKKKQDRRTRLIFAALQQAFPDLLPDIEQVVYCYNPVAIRVRVISEAFQGKSDSQRERMIMSALKDLPNDVTDDITLLLMRTPDEAEASNLTSRFLELEFDEPTNTYL